MSDAFSQSKLPVKCYTVKFPSQKTNELPRSSKWQLVGTQSTGRAKRAQGRAKRAQQLRKQLSVTTQTVTMGKRQRSSQVSGTKRAKSTKSKKRNARVTVPRNKLGFPQQIKTTLRYAFRTEFALNNENAVVTQIRANDLYDPEVALGGHQPRGFDDFMKIYDKFTVTGSKCSAAFTYEGYYGPTMTGLIGNLIQNTAPLPSSAEVPALPPVTCGVFKSTESMGVDTAQVQIEKDRQRWTYLTPHSGAKTIKQKLLCSDFFGKETLIGSDGYSGDETKSPSNQILWEVWAARNDDNYHMGAVRVSAYVVVEYDCVFTEPKILAAS